MVQVKLGDKNIPFQCVKEIYRKEAELVGVGRRKEMIPPFLNFLRWSDQNASYVCIKLIK